MLAKMWQKLCISYSKDSYFYTKCKNQLLGDVEMSEDDNLLQMYEKCVSLLIFSTTKAMRSTYQSLSRRVSVTYTFSVNCQFSR